MLNLFQGSYSSGLVKKGLMAMGKVGKTREAARKAPAPTSFRISLTGAYFLSKISLSICLVKDLARSSIFPWGRVYLKSSNFLFTALCLILFKFILKTKYHDRG